MKRYTLILTTLLLSLQFMGEQPLSRYDNLLWASPNIASSNASMLSTISLDLPDFTKYTDVALIFNYDEGTLGCPRTPKSTRDIMFSTKSIQRLGENTYLMGYFDYRFRRLNEVEWHGLTLPESHAMSLTDSIPGPFSSEAFFVGMKVAHRINNHVVGLTLNYDIGSGAKTIDLRNTNHRAHFNLSPSWMMQQPWGYIGFDAGFHRTVEEVNYTQVVTEMPRQMFRLEGLWFVFSELWTSAYTRFIEDMGYMANISLDMNLGGEMKLYNQFGIDYTQGSQYLRSVISNEQFGDQEMLRYIYRGTLKINNRNQIRANFQRGTKLAYRFLQRVEMDPRTTQQIRVTYGRTNHYSEVRSIADLTFAHASLRNGNPLDQTWRAEIGAVYAQRTQMFRRFPYMFKQEVNTYEFFANFNKNIPLSGLTIDLKPEFSFASGHGIMNDRHDLHPDAATLLAPQDDWQLQPQLKHEFDYLTASKIGAGLEAKIAYPLERITPFLNVRATYKRAMNTDLAEMSRMYISLHLGLNF